MPTTILDLGLNNDAVTANHREPVIGLHYEPPAVGQWLAGDIIYNKAIAAGLATGWICKTSGNPGVWTALPETF